MEDKVGSLLFAGTRPVGATSMMKELGKAIIETNESFTASNMLSLMRIVNVYSQEDDSALQVSRVTLSQTAHLLARQIKCQGIVLLSTKSG